MALGVDIAVSAVAAWGTPLGDVPVAAALRRHLLAAAPEMQNDDLAHKYEHRLK